MAGRIGARTLLKKLSVGALALIASGCASSAVMTPVNSMSSTPQGEAVTPGLGLKGDVIALAFSGGGARASAFSQGVLLELRDMRTKDGGRLIDQVKLVTAVSGGSITAAWFGLNGPDGLDGFRAAALDKDWAGGLHDSWISPMNWRRVWDGGMNGSDKTAGWLDREVYGGARLGAFRTGVRVILNAAEMYTASPFAFTPFYLEGVCSRRDDILVADAVAASMAVPVAFRPTVVATYGASCPTDEPDWVAQALENRHSAPLVRDAARAFRMWRDPERMKFLHLADGGVIDNFGLTSLLVEGDAQGDPLWLLSEEDAVRLHHLTIVVVNAERSVGGSWPLEADGPGGAQVVGAVLDVSIDGGKRLALAAFSERMKRLEADLISYRCALSAVRARELGANGDWRCDDVGIVVDMMTFQDLPDDQAGRLGDVATAVSLPAEVIDDLIAGGRKVAASNAAFKAMAQ